MLLYVPRKDEENEVFASSQLRHATFTHPYGHVYYQHFQCLLYTRCDQIRFWGLRPLGTRIASALPSGIQTRENKYMRICTFCRKPGEHSYAHEIDDRHSDARRLQHDMRMNTSENKCEYKITNKSNHKIRPPDLIHMHTR